MEKLEIIYNKAIDPLLLYIENGNKEKRLFNNNEYFEIYSLCYNLCISQNEKINWSDILYKEYEKILINFLNRKLIKVNNNNIIIKFIEIKDKFFLLSKWLNKLFVYVNRYHIKQCNIPSLEENANIIFINNYLYNVSNNVMNYLEKRLHYIEMIKMKILMIIL